MKQKFDYSSCPLCQKNNDCGVSRDTPCWCMTEKIPKALIEKIPKDRKNLACICQQCVKKYNLELGFEVK